MATIIPSARVTVTVEDMSVSLVCFDHANASLGDRRAAGRLKGYVEAALAANPGLASLGPILPLGTVIDLPEFAVASQAKQQARLWD